MNLQQRLDYIQRCFLDDCNWKVDVSWDADNEQYIAHDPETKANVTCRIDSDDDALTFVTGMGRTILVIEFPEDWDSTDDDMDEEPLDMEQDQ